MNLKRRYCCLLSGISFLLLVVLHFGWRLGSDHDRDSAATADGGNGVVGRGYVGEVEALSETDSALYTSERRKQVLGASDSGFFSTSGSWSSRDCRMSNCFNVSMCRYGFRVHIHSEDAATTGQISSKYAEILRALRSSRYYTDDPNQACLFVLPIDTLDRDRLSAEYVPNIQSRIDSLKWWRGGVNHVVFNLYFGTWPDYDEHALGFDTGFAMLAKASTSRLHYRPGFDISFPLFHKELSFRGGEPGALTSNLVPPVRKYLLSFKGKRYLTGIGSETRNSLYHIHNGHDVILLTTCKHGKGWKNLEDKRCETDNLEYDKWDYKMMLKNSTFCLVPRGRRLGSYRFLEVLQAACIPVILSNDWVLPFSEVIDWNKAAVWTDERLLLQVPGVVRSIGPEDTHLMKQQSQFLWETYFSSIEKIVTTTLEIIKERVEPFMSRSQRVWNTLPGALVLLPDFSQSYIDFPFYWRQLDIEHRSKASSKQFTAVIYSSSSSSSSAFGGVFSPSSSVYRLAKVLVRSPYLYKVIFLWRGTFPTDVRWPFNVRIPVVHKLVQPFSEIETDAVLSLTDDVELIADEVEFMLSVWLEHPDRIVGVTSRNHIWDDTQQRWSYSSKSTNDYSIIRTQAAFFHRYYLYLYANWLPQSVQAVIAHIDNCDDLALNFLVSHVTRQPPIKVASVQQPPRLQQPVDVINGNFVVVVDETESKLLASRRLAVRQYCVSYLVEQFGYVPLIRSSVRYEPLLFKDSVSILRKKYRHMETNGVL